VKTKLNPPASAQERREAIAQSPHLDYLRLWARAHGTEPPADVIERTVSGAETWINNRVAELRASHVAKSTLYADAEPDDDVLSDAEIEAGLARLVAQEEAEREALVTKAIDDRVAAALDARAVTKSEQDRAAVIASSVAQIQAFAAAMWEHVRPRRIKRTPQYAADGKTIISVVSEEIE
jgi:hypothetical protein